MTSSITSAPSTNRFSQLLSAKLAAEQPQQPDSVGAQHYSPYPQGSSPGQSVSEPSSTAIWPPDATRWPPAGTATASVRIPDLQQGGRVSFHDAWQQQAWPSRSNDNEAAYIPSTHSSQLQSATMSNQPPTPVQPVPVAANWMMRPLQPSENGPVEDQKPQLHQSGSVPPYMTWRPITGPQWVPQNHMMVMGSQIPVPCIGVSERSSTQRHDPPSHLSMRPSQTPALSHRSCESVDSTAPPMTPLAQPTHSLPSTEDLYGPYAPSKRLVIGSHPHLTQDAATDASNGDMSGYIGVGQNRNGTMSGLNGDGNGYAGYGSGNDGGNGGDDGLPPGIPGGGGGGDDGGGNGGGGDDGDQDGQNGLPSGSTPKRVKLPLACHFCRRRKLK